LREAAVVRELERLTLDVGELFERRLHTLALETKPGGLFGLLGCLCGLALVGERVGLPSLLASDEVDRAPVHEREDPRARLRALGTERRCVPPDLEKCLLDGVFCVSLVSNDAEREAVGDPAHPVVQLGESILVASRDECDQGFVGEMSVLPAHGEPVDRLGQS